MFFKQIDLCILGCFLQVFFSGCKHHEFDNWQEWREQISGIDLEKKYNKWGGLFSVSYNKDAIIRKDFTEKYNKFILSNIGLKYLGGTEPHSLVMEELVRLKMVGACAEGDTLHIANSLLREGEFPSFVEKYRFHLNLQENASTFDDFQYCLFGTINSFF